jgi:hypothetical protein
MGKGCAGLGAFTIVASAADLVLFRFATAVLAIVCIASCGGRVGEQIATSAHVQFDTMAGRGPACAASPNWLDSVLGRQAAFLNLNVPEIVPYHWRPPPDDLPCPPGAVACADSLPLAVYARPPDMVHELVHAILGANMGVMPVSFFNEALAVALGGPDHGGEPAPNYDRPLDPIIGAETLPFSEYALAGDFGSYLLSSRNPANYVELLRHAPHGASAATVRSAFVDAYGESIDDVVAQRRASGRTFPAYRMSFPECSIPPVPWDGASWHDGIEVDCAGRGIGPIFGEDPPTTYTLATVDVPSDGYYHATVASTAGSASLNRCTDGARTAFLSFEDTPPGAGRREVLGALDKGVHFFTLRARTGIPASFSIDLEPTTSASAACATLSPLDIGDDTYGIELLGGSTAIVASIRVGVASSWTVEAAADSALWACIDPCTMSTCRQLSSGTAISLSAGSTYSFRARGNDVALHRARGQAPTLVPSSLQ